MPRPLRFEYPGALYHVLNRGNYRSWIFEDDGAKRSFEKCLWEAAERSGWIVHAYCVMGNHYHLALETPQPNLSEGMRWLQGVFATRYNRYRSERGHLFQGRFKSILLEDRERLAWLCHYIHLNPVRAGMARADGLREYLFSSFVALYDKRKRPAALEVDAFLEGCGGLRDTPTGRSKYAEYLAWLAEDQPRQKAMLFERMSEGWAHGTKDFKKALLKEAEKERTRVEIGESAPREALELLWEVELERCLDALGRDKSLGERDRKFADWKVAVCAWMKRHTLCRNRWLSEQLHMGTDAALSRYVKRLADGELTDGSACMRKLERTLGRGSPMGRSGA